MQLLPQPMLGFLFIGSIIGLLTTILMIWMLIDAITNQALDGTMKIVWILVILLLPLIGSILYFVLARGGNVSRPRF